MAKAKPDGARSPAVEAVYEQLKKVRASKTVSLKPIPRLKDTIVGFDGKPQPLKIRYYQVQGAYHLMLMKRMILGDGTGLGKSLEAIAALSYLWEKEPTNKVIVVAPKSAIRQWASEIKRFTNGVKPIVAAGSLDERRAAYKAWAEAPTGPNDPKVVLILNYAILIRDWNQDGFQPTLPNGKIDPKKPVIPGVLDGFTQRIGPKSLVTIYDECFDYYTPITLADGSSNVIGKIVCSKLPVEVLSWNFERQQIEARKVIRWIKNPLKGGAGGMGRRQHLVKLEFAFARSCRVTKSHRFYRLDGTSVPAWKLKVGSETAHLNLRAPSEDQKQIILGGLMGDASVSHPLRPNWGVTFVQGAAQKPYLDFKKDVLATLGVGPTDTARSGYGEKSIFRFRLHSNPSVCSAFQIHDGRRKCLTAQWLDAINPLGLAVWYGDDGSIQSHTCKDGRVSHQIILNTQGFTWDEHQLLVGWLQWRWGVAAQIKTTQKGPKKYHYLYLAADAAERFLSLLPGALPGVEYKFPGKPILRHLDSQPKQELVRDRVTKKGAWTRAPKKRDSEVYVYDLEVEGNHNYFAGDTLVSNCTAFKNMRTKTWEVARFLSDRSHRCYGLTATLLKNNLIEGYCIYKVIKSDLFGTKTKFYEDYCFIELKRVGKARIPIILGYKNLDAFRNAIDPFFLGRPRHAVSDELPTLTTREITFEISRPEELKYKEALNGILELGDGEVRDFEEHKALVSLIYCQQIVDSISLLRFKEGDELTDNMFLDDEEVHKVGKLGSKEQAFLDLLQDELDGEKVIVYTRFESLVGRLQAILADKKIKSTRITGKESDKVRRDNQEAFQDLKSDTLVVFITDAGSEAINLQAASAMVFYDMPWSWGNYIQILGRMIRIGSPHPAVVAYHLLAERPDVEDTRTIDHHVLKLLRKKKQLIDKVLGEAAVGALKFEKGEGSGVLDLLRAMQGKKVPGVD